MFEKLAQASPDTLQSIASITSVVVAVVALIIAFIVEWRNNSRFELQAEESKKRADGNVKPLLVIYSTGYPDFHSLTLVNQGVGPAIITRHFFNNRGITGSDFKSVLDLSRYSKANIFYWRFGGTMLVVPPQDKRTITSISYKDQLAENNTELEARKLLSNYWNDIQSIKLEIKYKDIYGNFQPKCEWRGDGKSPTD